MAKPVSKVLVINDEPLILRELLKGLNAAARALDNPFGITFIGALTAKEGLALIERDTSRPRSSTTAVRSIRRNGAGRRGKRSLQVSALSWCRDYIAASRTRHLHPDPKEKEIRCRCAVREAVDGISIAKSATIAASTAPQCAIAERRALRSTSAKAYVMAAKDAWHTLHSSGDSMRGNPWVNEFYDFMGEHVFDATYRLGEGARLADEPTA
jgi:arginine decarboxylase